MAVTGTPTEGNDILQSDTASDSINGLGGNDVLIGNDGADTLNGGTGGDTLIGGAGSDSYIVDDAGDVVTETDSVAASGGTDVVNTSISYALGANIENLTGRGTAGISLTGNLLVNTITGNTGANVLDGGLDTAGGAGDTLIGGQGNDTYIVRDGAVSITELADSDLNGTVGGSDQVIVIASQVRTSFTLAAGAVVETVIASDGGSTLGLDLIGNATAQALIGNAGINALTGGGGADTLIGLDGDDIYNIVARGTVVTEAAGAGRDTVNIVAGADSGTYVLGDNVEVISASGVAAGTVVNITGGTNAQTITGSAGDNLLVGGGGADSIAGGLGNDTFVVDSLDDLVSDTGGTDRVIASSSFATNTTGGIEYLIAGGTTLSTRSGQGDGTFNLNALNTTVTSNYLVGNSATGELIFGDAGGNILNGFRNNGDEAATAATITANPADTLIGGGGNDIYRVYAQSDVVVEDSAGGVQDFVYTNVDYNLATNDTNAAAVTFVDDTAAADGGPQTRTIGGAGNYVNGPMQIEVLSAADQVSTTALNLTGNAFGQIIIGNYGANAITDGGSLIGTTRFQDQLAGLRGNDTYNVSAQNTTVNENIGEGTDVVNVTLAAGGFFTLIDQAEVEYLNAGGAAAFNLRGNQFNQIITGNAAVNTLDGNGGQDTLVGGAGNDVYVVTAANTGNVSIVEATMAAAAGDGDGDTVSTSVSFDLGATNVAYTDSAGAAVVAAGTIGIEAIVVTNGQSTDAINLTGNGAAQLLVGNFGANVLNGDNDTGATVNGVFVPSGTADTNGATDGGADTLTGLLGDDSYRVYSQADVVRENGGEGTDVVFTSANYQLRTGNSIETLSAASQSSTTGLVLVGNEFSQTVIGTAGADQVWGGRGNDVLLGGAGIDIFGFAETGTANADILQDFTPGDTIGLFSNGAGSAFASVGTALTSDEFIVGSQAGDANDFIVYNQTTGQLFYDADGSGTANAAVLFATLVPGTGLGFNDFTILTTAPTAIPGA